MTAGYSHAPPMSAGANGNGATYDPLDVLVREPLPKFPLTDQGNAERLRHWQGGNLLFCGPWNKWLWFDGARYRIDTNGEVGRRTIETVRKIHLEAANEEEQDRRSAIAKHAISSESDARVRALLSRARELFPVEPEEFDADPLLLNCHNGTLDLRTGDLRAHRKDDRLTKTTGIAFDPDADCPRWLAFLHRVMAGSEALISFLQRAAGYGLTGLTVEQVLLFFWGTGRNGKSVFIKAMQHAMGDYAKSTRPETLMVKQGSDIPNDVAALVGARLVATVEVEEGSRLAESLIKQLTGGDRISARFLRGEFFEFTPTFKIVMAGNHKPVIRGTDMAIWERILTVPFTITIPREERDRELPQKLEEEAPGILAWMVEGCRQWQVRGLDPPPEVRAATEEYRGEMDILAQFLEECCENEYAAVTTAADLYERYGEWAKTAGERQWSQQLFGRRLRERGYQPDRVGQTRIWQGVRVRPAADA